MARLQTQLFCPNVPRFGDHTSYPRGTSGPETQRLTFHSKRSRSGPSALPPAPSKRPVGAVQA